MVNSCTPKTQSRRKKKRGHWFHRGEFMEKERKVGSSRLDLSETDIKYMYIYIYPCNIWGARWIFMRRGGPRRKVAGKRAKRQTEQIGFRRRRGGSCRFSRRARVCHRRQETLAPVNNPIKMDRKPWQPRGRRPGCDGHQTRRQRYYYRRTINAATGVTVFGGRGTGRSSSLSVEFVL